MYQNDVNMQRIIISKYTVKCIILKDFKLLDGAFGRLVQSLIESEILQDCYQIILVHMCKYDRTFLLIAPMYRLLV